jgi:hypothetical protein
MIISKHEKIEELKYRRSCAYQQMFSVLKEDHPRNILAKFS